MREDLLDLRPAERGGRAFTRPRAPPARAARAAAPGPVRVALRRPDRHPGRGRDLLEREVERVLQHDDARLRRRDARRGRRRARRAARTAPPRAPGRRRGRRARPRRAARSGGARWRSATSRHVLTTSRWSQVENCASPRNWRIRTQSFASASCAASRASSPSPSRWRLELLDARARGARRAPRAPAGRRPLRVGPGSGRSASRSQRPLGPQGCSIGRPRRSGGCTAESTAALPGSADQAKRLMRFPSGSSTIA